MTFAPESASAFGLQNSLDTQLPLPTASTAYGLVDSVGTTQVSGSSSFDIISISPAVLPKIPIAYSGDTLSTATNLGTLNGRQVESGSVSSSDRYDYFRFTTTAPGSISLSLSGSGTGDADVYLIRDFNGNGVVNPGDTVAQSTIDGNFESLRADGLAAGTYYALVQHYGGGTANYTLALTSDTAGDSLTNARNLGAPVGSGSVSDFVGYGDENDFYRLQINNTSTLNLSLTGLSSDADLYLIRDFNQNGIVDDSDILEESIEFGTASEFISAQGLAAGSYFIGVEQYSGNTNYTLNYSVSNTEPGGTLSTAADLGTLTGQRSIAGSVSPADQSDIYHFNLNTVSDLQLNLGGLSADADLYLSRDFNNNGVIDVGERLGVSNRSGSLAETIDLSNLAAGTYFAEVRQWSSNTSYTLTLNADGAGETLPTARNIGILSGDRSFTDFVGESDAIDAYRFTTTATGNLTLNLSGLTADADLYLIRDLNNNGLRESNEIIAASMVGGSNPDSINFYDLAAGTYFAEVRQYSGNTNYRLDLSLSATRPDPGNTLSTATNLGSLNGQRILSDSLNFGDREDLYRFSLSSTSNVQLALSGLTADADLRLIRDSNNNGIVDTGDVLQSSMSFGSLSELITTSGLAPGSYFVDVRGYGNITNYTLSLTADAAGSTLSTARNVGLLSGSSGFTDFVSSQDPFDVYRFSLSNTRSVNINLSGLVADADLYLGQDFNGNGTIDAGETLAFSIADGTVPESISLTLGSGTYYAWVEQYSGEGNYRLDLRSSLPGVLLS